MIIRDVLKSKGSRIETVHTYRPVSEILQNFDERNISSIVVINPVGKPLVSPVKKPPTVLVGGIAVSSPRPA